MDGVIAGGWLLLAVLVARLWRRLGAGAWREWQQAFEWDPRDETVMRGLHALARVKAYASESLVPGTPDWRRLSALTRFSDGVLGGDVLAGVPRWRGQVRLLSLSPEVRPLGQRGLSDPWLRALAWAERALLRLPGRPRGLVRLRRHLAALHTAARLVDWRVRQRPPRARVPGVLLADRRALEQAALEAHAALSEGLRSRREQLSGPRH